MLGASLLLRCFSSFCWPCWPCSVARPWRPFRRWRFRLGLRWTSWLPCWLCTLDLVTTGWSRVFLYSLLALFLFGRSLEGGPTSWAAQRAMAAAGWFLGHNLLGFSDLFMGIGRWLSSAGNSVVDQLFGLPFWPFEAMTDAIRSGAFTSAQALAPAISCCSTLPSYSSSPPTCSPVRTSS